MVSGVVEDNAISIEHIDIELGQPRKIHKFDDGTIVITHLRKEAKSMVGDAVNSVQNLDACPPILHLTPFP